MDPFVFADATAALTGTDVADGRLPELLPVPPRRFLLYIGWEWDRRANVRGRSPPIEGYGKGHKQVPEGSDSAHACGA